MFSRQQAVETLSSILGILARQYANLDEHTRRDLSILVRQYAPAIVDPPGNDQVQPILALLEQLWQRRDLLPPGAVTALQAAQDAPDRFIVRTTATERELLGDALRQWVGFSSSGEVSPRQSLRRVVPRPATDTGPALPRFANVYFPGAILVTQKRVPLIIHIARQPGIRTTVSRDEAGLRLTAGDLTIVLGAQDFSIEGGAGGQGVGAGENVRRVEVVANRDCGPVVFFLTPRTTGTKRITLDLFQCDRSVRTLAFPVEVVTEPARLGSPVQAAIEGASIEAMAFGMEAPPPDLELRVMLADDGRRLSFRLHSPAGAAYNHQFVGETRLAAEPRVVLEPLFDRLSTLARQPTGDSPKAIAELANIGNGLYEQLFPVQLKEEYRRFRETHAGKTLLITSDEPFIPWELVKPFASDSGGAVLYDDPPLCEMFHVSRWLAGRGTPDRIVVRRGVWVAPPDNLDAAAQEGAYFSGLNSQRPDADLVGPLGALDEVEARFVDGQTELFHFACHGNFNTDDPNESKLRLAGDFLRPSQLAGARKAGLQRSRPFIFLNACHSGRVGAGLTGLGGWAQGFIECGASAFVGSTWEINDALAARFMRELYDRLWGLNGCAVLPLAAAFHDARLATRDAAPGNPTWLAYVLYGDPYGTVVLGEPTTSG